MSSRKRILIIGSRGQVGFELKRTLSTLGEVKAVDHEELDLSDPDSMRRHIRDYAPDIIVNAAAYTAVDLAEKEPEKAMAVNGEALRVLAEEAKAIGALLVHYSTDYVFDGTATTPYHEEHPIHPLNVYGMTKAAGEEALRTVGGRYIILRTSWVYGSRGKNFLLTMLKLGRERTKLTIVNDQIGAPTWSRSIAQATAQILANKDLKTVPSGIYHLTCSGMTSWHGFAEAIFTLAKEKQPNLSIPVVDPIPSSQYPTPAKRPHFSLLSNEKIQRELAIFMPDWEEALRQCMDEAFINI